MHLCISACAHLHEPTCSTPMFTVYLYLICVATDAVIVTHHTICSALLTEHWENKGVLKLRTAFSRDQSHKIYVQDLLLADADSIWSLLHNQSAHVYVCGDARQMASDVHKALIKIVTECGQMIETDAVSYISHLESAGRYQKDVWVT